MQCTNVHKDIYPYIIGKLPNKVSLHLWLSWASCEILRDRGPNSAQILCPWPEIYRNSYKILLFKILFLISQKSFQNINRDAENHTLFPSTQSASVSLTSHQFRNPVAHHLWNTNKWGELSSRPHDSPLCIELFNYLTRLSAIKYPYIQWQRRCKVKCMASFLKEGTRKVTNKTLVQGHFKMLPENLWTLRPPTHQEGLYLCLWALSSVLWSCFSFHNFDTDYIVSIVWLVCFLSV